MTETEFTLPCDIVVNALGQVVEEACGLAVERDGSLAVRRSDRRDGAGGRVRRGRCRDGRRYGDRGGGLGAPRGGVH